MSLPFAKSCRVCLSEQTDDNFFDLHKTFDLFTDGFTTLNDIFSFCTHLQIKPENGLPQRICADCFKDLKIAYIFIKKALESDHVLNNNETIDSSECGVCPVKDPLENVSDSEEENESGIMGSAEIINNVHNSLQIITPEYIDDTDNDNRFENLLNLAPASPSFSECSDKDENDFLVSVESQIFPQGRFKCKLCEKLYFTNIGLTAHMEFHTPKSKNAPGETIKPASKRKRRKKTNDIISEGSEDESKKVMKRRNDCKQPKVKKMFPCNVCGKQMISASKLRYHMVMHTGEKDYLCTICPKAYSTIYALKHHLRAHTGERPYECQYCGDRFLRPTTLKSHMRRHTGERPYGCEICGKRFIQHSSMATHMKLNHMDKTISCPYCDKKYARQTDLNVHLLSHSGDKPFACKLCPSRFTRQSNLNKHLNQQHHEIAEMDKEKCVSGGESRIDP